MSETVGTFGYIGGKTTLAPWISSYLPDHEVYVEPFGGSAGVLANKQESPLEVYNDIKGYCVDFFKAVKHHPDELEYWIWSTPCSRELFDEYVHRLENDPPDDLVERAGMFWYIRATSFGGRGVTDGGGGVTFAVSKSNHRDTKPEKYKRMASNIFKVVERFRDVQIEHADFEEILGRYGGEDTVFYCDPPYVSIGDDYYQDGEEFDHSRFVEALEGLDAYWLVSYDQNVPDGLSDYHTVRRGKESTLDIGHGEKTEVLVMNYDPDKTPLFHSATQQTLSTSVGGKDD